MLPGFPALFFWSARIDAYERRPVGTREAWEHPRAPRESDLCGRSVFHRTRTNLPVFVPAEPLYPFRNANDVARPSGNINGERSAL